METEPCINLDEAKQQLAYAEEDYRNHLALARYFEGKRDTWQDIVTRLENEAAVLEPASPA
ncbi:MAG: hypothetical protein KDE56_08100 [Anaerolineales bacterium]|nr:hypothetical protein [Anaerolineales bacterium]